MQKKGKKERKARKRRGLVIIRVGSKSKFCRV